MHTSDVHLDNRVGESESPSGGEVGFSRVIDKALALEVDLFLLAGDLFAPGNESSRRMAFQMSELAGLLRRAQARRAARASA